MEQTTRVAHPGHQPQLRLDDADRHGLYKTIFNRRDVRGQFRPDPIPDALLSRVLYAAHHAPSVGFMQPWDFLLVRDGDVKRRVRDLFATAHAEAAEMFPEEKRATYRALKLEGIMESPLNVCITCDRERTGPTVIGRTHIRTMDLYSSVCAVQNFWLAARTEGLGVGWVSILDQERLKEVLGIPPHVEPVAYLCVGYVEHLYSRPELESAGWLPRLPLAELLHFDRWDARRNAEEEPLMDRVARDRGFPSEY